SWDQGACRIFGLPEDDAPRDYAAYLAVLHPEDRARVQAHIAAAVQSGEFGDLEHRLVRPDGEVRFVYSRGSVARDEHGKVTMLRGGLLDITDRKHLEEQLR